MVSLARDSEGSTSPEAPIPPATPPDGENSNQHRYRRSTRNSRYVLIVRIGFILFLLASATFLGWLSHYLLKGSEEDLANTKFSFVSDRALQSSRDKISKQAGASRTDATMISNFYPDLEEWPFVSVPGFDQILAAVQETARGRDGGFAPLIKPEQALEWEEFAYEYIEKWYPPGFGVSEFGKGIFACDFSLNNTDKRFHDISGDNTCGSPYKYLNPSFHYTSPGSGGFRDVLMINVYSVCYAARALDAMLDHTTLRLQASLNNETVPEPKGFWQGFSWPPYDFPAELGPATSYIEPVIPRNHPFNMTATAGVQIRWMDVLTDIFEKDVNGVYCVIERKVDGSYVDAFTYKIVGGVPVFVGEGNLPGIDWKERASIGLVEPQDLLPGASEYSLYLYSTDEFYDIYETNNPLIATIVTVSVMVFTVLVFLLYDKLLRKEVRHREDVLAAQRQFMRFVSHEVRTPLNTVCMGLKLVQEEVDNLDAKDREVPGGTSAQLVGGKGIQTLAQEVSSTVDDAVSILDDLLNFDSIQHGELNLEFTVLPIWSVIEATFNEFRLPSKAKEIDLALQLPGDMKDNTVSVETSSEIPTDLLELRSVGDRIRLAQVLRNCMSNALRSTPENGKVTVRASYVPCALSDKHPIQDEFDIELGEGNVSYQRTGAVVIDVVDTGPGMTREQVNMNELRTGTEWGLGLDISKKLVERHDGNLTASSEGLGKGSTFTITIPLYHVPDSMLPSHLRHLRVCPEDASSMRTSEVTKNQVSETSVLNVLVVDDAALNRKMLVRLLEKRGYVCHQAADGQQAVEVYQQLVENGVAVDSVLMDYEMPVMNGPHSCKVLRGLGCRAFIAGVTGNVLQDDVDYFKSCGADAVLAKPLKIHMLEGLWREKGIIS